MGHYLTCRHNHLSALGAQLGVDRQTATEPECNWALKLVSGCWYQGEIRTWGNRSHETRALHAVNRATQARSKLRSDATSARDNTDGTRAQGT